MEFFKTLGHSARIRILELLSEREHAVHELLNEIAIEPSNLSHQLAVLRRTGLVNQMRREGQVMVDIWAGIDAGKREHHCVVINGDGTQLLSQRITNDDETLLGLIAEVCSLASGGHLHP